jgi:hypothetical protein
LWRYFTFTFTFAFAFTGTAADQAGNQTYHHQTRY